MYDYIVVGAGSAGCVVAARTAERGTKVLLLEAGGRDELPLIRIPAAYAALQDTHMDWGYRTVSQPQLNGRRIFWPRGRVLGGSSSLNYMCYVRGNRGDYDHWRQLGNVGWGYDDVLPYFKRAEKNERLNDRFHGTSGPVSVRDNRNRRLGEIFIEASIEQGLRYNEDFNGAEQEGCGILQCTIDDRGRCSTAVGYLRPVADSGNPTVETNALAIRLIIEKDRAVGIQYLTPRGLESAYASVEVILCGGAINSPQLLMLSGSARPTSFVRLALSQCTICRVLAGTSRITWAAGYVAKSASRLRSTGCLRTNCRWRNANASSTAQALWPLVSSRLARLHVAIRLLRTPTCRSCA